MRSALNGCPLSQARSRVSNGRIVSVKRQRVTRPGGRDRIRSKSATDCTGCRFISMMTNPRRIGGDEGPGRVHADHHDAGVPTPGSPSARTNADRDRARQPQRRVAGGLPAPAGAARRAGLRAAISRGRSVSLNCAAAGGRPSALRSCASVPGRRARDVADQLVVRHTRGRRRSRMMSRAVSRRAPPASPSVTSCTSAPRATDKLERALKIGRHVGEDDPDEAARDPPRALKLRQDRDRLVDWHREADVGRARAQRRVDPDHLAARVDERSAAVAEIDRGVGLDVVVEARVEQLPADEADYPDGHRVHVASGLPMAQTHSPHEVRRNCPEARFQRPAPSL